MLRTLRLSLPLAAALLCSSPGRTADPVPEDLSAALSRLSVSLDRLAAAMEKTAAGSDDARAGQRVQVAIGILGLRTRKVERLEAEIRQLGNEGEDIKNQFAVLKAQLEEIDEKRRQEGQEATPDEIAIQQQMKSQMDRGLVFAEARLRTLEERKTALQTELDAELRGLAGLEAMLSDWLKRQP